MVSEDPQDPRESQEASEGAGERPAGEAAEAAGGEWVLALPNLETADLIQHAKSDDAARIIEWLDARLAAGQRVLYVAFGSEISPSEPMMRLLAGAFEEASEMHVLWATKARPTLPLPSRVLVTSFAPQRAVLTHGAVFGFLSHGGANCSPFSLEGVLKACEHRGYRAAAQPRGVALPLKRYQAQALAWMRDMEQLPRGINGLFWESAPSVTGGRFTSRPSSARCDSSRRP